MITAGTIVTAVGCGLMAGLFFVFSNFMMGSLGRLSPGEGMRAMQQINRDILNPLFLLVLMGTLLLSLVLGVAAVVNWSDPGSPWLLAGCLLYVVGVFGVTMVLNVPLNNRLDRSDSESAEGLEFWAFFLKRWTALNHLRTVANTASLVALLLALAA